MTNKGRRNRLLWSLAIALTAGPLLAAEPTTKPAPGRIRLTISRKTTHILGPVKKDGTVNYAAYLNSKRSKGVTRENNAAIPLIKILGPDFLPKDARGKICKMLEIKLSAKGKERFISASAYVDKTANDQGLDDWVEYEDLDKARTKPWKPKQYPVIARWLRANDSALNAVHVAVRRNRYHVPVIMSSPDTNVMTLALPNSGLCTRLAHALEARAMLRLDSGDISGAWADLMAIRHLARRIGSGYTLVENLAGIGFEAIGCFGCREVATSRELTGTQARTFLADLQRIGPMPDLVSILDEGERFFILDSIMVLARATNRRGLRGFKDALKNMDISAEKRLAALPDTLPYMRSLEWDEVLKIVNPPYDSFIAAARRKTFKAQTEALAAYDRRVEGFAAKVNKLRSLRLTRRTVSRMIGCVLASQSMPGRAVILRDRGTVEGELSVVAMALAAYRAEKKAYPDKLSGLSPGYLKKVPDDLFVDKPFGYKRTGKGYLLYSVGENMKYDGEKKEDDIVVEVK